MDNVIIDVDDVKKRLNILNMYKSYVPDMLHPRISKELQNEIALPIKLIFECSLKTSTLPEDWKLGNITPIFKKGKFYVNFLNLFIRDSILSKIRFSVQNNLVSYRVGLLLLSY